MLYNVPYIVDREYTAFLGGLSNSLHSVHFSLYTHLLNDGRVRMGGVDVADLVAQLGKLRGPRKYLLANGRFHLPDHYLGQERLPQLVEKLLLLREAGVLDGIVFSDGYLLVALAKQAPQLVACLEAVPSINFILDNIEKITTLIELVEGSGFLPPTKLALDRELNRKPKKLEQLVTSIRKCFPTIKIELLANEGCLRNCPFRATHEALIAAANNGLPIDTQQINQKFGCLQILANEPHRILASPYIRPEDVHHYESLVDIIKICGRSLGAEFLTCTVKSYIEGTSPENLLSLLDAAYWMADHWALDGERLPDDFYLQMTNCDGVCGSCQVCGKFFENIATIIPFRLKRITKS